MTSPASTPAGRQPFRIPGQPWTLLGGCLFLILCLVVAPAGLLATGALSGPAGLDNARPAWSPDGTRLAFDSNRGGNWDIFVMNEDGSQVQQLTRDPAASLAIGDAASDTYPAWSPDGTRLAFIAGHGLGWTSTLDNDVFIMNADGSGLEQVTGLSKATPLCANITFEDRPVWSPDGARIAFASQCDGNWDVYVAEVGGQGALRLTTDLAVDRDPTWSPDGFSLAFTSNRGGAWDIYRMDAKGANVVNLTNDAAEDRQPAWSPDGKLIALQSDREGSWDIWVMNADGSQLIRLASPGMDAHPAWSPDGTRIAFDTDRDGPRDIYLMNADGSRVVKRTGQ